MTSIRLLGPRGALVAAVVAGLGLGCATESTEPAQLAPATPPGPTVPYDFDRRAYDDRLAQAADEATRRAVLDERFDGVLKIAAYVHVVHDPEFYMTLSQHRFDVSSPADWSRRIDSDLDQPIEVAQHQQCRIEGDCRADVRAVQSGIVHILGDLTAKLVVDGQPEIVIGGSVTESGAIVADGITSVLVGGDFRGSIVSSGSLRLWVHGSMSGRVDAGEPSTDINVMGDFTGTIQPHDEVAQLNVDVHGFMAEATAKSMGPPHSLGAAVSIARSDTQAGLDFGGLGRFMSLGGLTVVHETLSPDGELKAAGSTVPYRFDRAAFDARLAAATTEPERAAVLSQRWDDVLKIVAYVSVVEERFFQTLMKEQLGLLSPTGLTKRVGSDSKEPLVLAEEQPCRIDGDCLAPIRAPEVGIVHILGDLKSTVIVGGQSEVVIAGSVAPSGAIVADGITRVLVGGDLEGTVVSSGSFMAWVNGSLRGQVETGTPMTELHVVGDFTGTLEPQEKGALLDIDVHGFMAQAAVDAILAHGYTSARFSIGLSDAEPGLRFGGPVNHSELTASWVVHKQDVKRAEHGPAASSVGYLLDLEGYTGTELCYGCRLKQEITFQSGARVVLAESPSDCSRWVTQRVPGHEHEWSPMGCWYTADSVACYRSAWPVAVPADTWLDYLQSLPGARQIELVAAATTGDEQPLRDCQEWAARRGKDK